MSEPDESAFSTPLHLPQIASLNGAAVPRRSGYCCGALLTEKLSPAPSARQANQLAKHYLTPFLVVT